MTTQATTPMSRDEILRQLKDLDSMPLDQSTEEGFILLAGALRLVDNAANAASEDYMSAEELNDCITDAAWGFPGRQGDGGLDAFWVNDTDRQICLFQSKLETYSRKELSDFLALPTRLSTPEFVNSVHNASVKEAALQFIDKLNDGYGIRLYFATTGSPSNADKRFVLDWSESPITIPMQAGTSINPVHVAEFIDRDAFTQKLIEINNLAALVEVDLNIKLDASFLHDTGDSRMLVCLVEAKEICRIFREKGFSIFRDNPRAVIESSKVNTSIKETLENDGRRTAFHLLNNGLNVTCSRFGYPDQPRRNQTLYESKIEDFQIVNGLQTTFTLRNFELNQGNLDGVYAICKISESASLNSDISRSSNSQTAVTGWDLVSLSETQKKIQKEFNEIPDSLRERRFYELKRGEAKYVETLAANTPLVKPKELTQAMVAFMGNPVMAKNNMKEIEKNITATTGDYVAAFNNSTTGYHLLLAWKTWTYVKTRLQTLLRQHAQDNTNPPEWLTHSRYHIFGLMGAGYIKKHSVTSFLEVSQDTLKEDLVDIDTWSKDLFTSGYDAVDFIQQVQSTSDGDAGRLFRPRQLFLTQNSWNRMRDRI